MEEEDFDLSQPGLIRFLETKRSRQDLEAALSVIEEFKQLETTVEYMLQPFSLWVRLEQLEDYLRLLLGKDVEKVNDGIAREYLMRHLAALQDKSEDDRAPQAD